MELAGVILDLYDDPNGLVLRRIFSGAEVPEKLASCTLLESEDLDRLPDHLFGLVALNHGHVVRKFAMHDEPHLLSSILYFDQRSHLLPEAVQHKVAANLVRGCRDYDVRPPNSLMKIAMAGVVGKAMTAIGALDTASQVRGAAVDSARTGAQRMNALRAGQALGKVASGREVELSDTEADAMAHGVGPESGHIFGLLPKFDDHAAARRKLDDQIDADWFERITKRADLNGTEIMTHQASRTGNVKAPPAGKIAFPEYQLIGDISHLSAPVIEKKASHTHFALPHLSRYPIDTAEQLTKAASYFDAHITEFPALERRLFSLSVVARAEELGVKVAGEVLSYGGTEYGPFIEAQLRGRVAAFEGTPKAAMYEPLLEHREEIEPAVMASLLKQADDATGAAASYGRPAIGFLDPYAAVYGQPKLAAAQPSKADMFSWREGAEYVNGWMLQQLASRHADLDNVFGKGFAVSFAKDPVSIFESMPDPQKVVLSRLASDNAGQTSRI